MNILHIIPNLRKGGAERLVTDIVRELSKREGIEVRLVLFTDEIGYDVDGIRHLIRVIPSSVQLSLWRKNKYNISALQQFLEDFQPDIIHTHLFEAEIISRSCFFPGAKWFSHAHDRMKSFNYLNLFTLLNKRILTDYVERKYLFGRYKKNGGNHFIAISRDIESYFSSVLPGEIRNVHRLGNAIFAHRFKNNLSGKVKLIARPYKIITVGRLDANKNHQFLLDCLSELKDRGFDFHLTIVGEGDQRFLLEKKINELNLSSEVTLPGVIDKVEELLWQSDLYVHSALSEGFGLTLLEAMAACLPVITLDGGGNRDLIEEGKNGYLIEEENAELFVERILQLINNPVLYKDMSEYARLFAQKFDIIPYVDQLLMLYRKESLCAE